MQHFSGDDWRGVVTHLFSNGLQEGAPESVLDMHVDTIKHSPTTLRN